MKYHKQVQKQHYTCGNYLHVNRWISYFHQIGNIAYVQKYMQKDTLAILEIGPGDKTVSTFLKLHNHDVTTMDIAEDLKPDIVAALPNIPIKKVDCILCCEVLEHIKYPDVETSLKNMAKKTRYAVLSVPHKSLYFSLIARVSLLMPLKFLLQIPTPFIKHQFDGQHYWELGTHGYSVKRFKKSIERAGFECMKDFRVVEFPYHHFFILKSSKYVT